MIAILAMVTMIAKMVMTEKVNGATMRENCNGDTGNTGNTGSTGNTGNSDIDVGK